MGLVIIMQFVTALRFWNRNDHASVEMAKIRWKGGLGVVPGEILKLKEL